MAVDAVGTETVEPAGGREIGWTDRLFAAIEGLPGPTWLAYVVIIVAWGLAAHAVPWVAGGLAPGTLDEQLTFTPPWVIYCVAMVHALDRLARSAFAAFRPTLDVDDAEAGRLAANLTRVPGRPAAIVIAFLGVLVFGGYALDPAAQAFGSMSESIKLVVGVNEFVTVIVLAILALHSVRQLQQVGRLHDRASRIDLFAPAPLYAFSRLTSWTGIGLLGLTILTLVLFPITTELAIGLPFVGVTIALAIACFVLPLIGMQRRIATEKARLQLDADSRLRGVIGWIHRGIDAADLSKAAELEATLTSLRSEREVVSKLPTWPWSTGTIRGFGSALFLPIALFLIQRYLGQLLG